MQNIKTLVTCLLLKKALPDTYYISLLCFLIKVAIIKNRFKFQLWLTFLYRKFITVKPGLLLSFQYMDEPKNAVVNAQNSLCCAEELKIKTSPLPLIAASLFTGWKASDYNSMDTVTFKCIWQRTQRAREAKRKNKDMIQSVFCHFYKYWAPLFWWLLSILQFPL